MTPPGSSRLSNMKMEQILDAGQKQLNPEEFKELLELISDLKTYGLTPWINSQLGKLMAKLDWQLAIEESPEWHEALKACDYAFLGSELKAMCHEVGASPVGHKKELCAHQGVHPAVHPSPLVALTLLELVDRHPGVVAVPDLVPVVVRPLDQGDEEYGRVDRPIRLVREESFKAGRLAVVARVGNRAVPMGIRDVNVVGSKGVVDGPVSHPLLGDFVFKVDNGRRFGVFLVPCRRGL